MTQPKEQNQGAAVDWEAAEMVAARLGFMARNRVAHRDPELVRDWCVQMARVHTGEGNVLRSMTYLELAVICGYRPREAEELAGHEWRELSQQAQQLAVAVSLKAAEEELAARVAAKEKEAVRVRAEAEAVKTPEDPGPDQPDPEAGEASPQEAA